MLGFHLISLRSTPRLLLQQTFCRDSASCSALQALGRDAAVETKLHACASPRRHGMGNTDTARSALIRNLPLPGQKVLLPQGSPPPPQGATPWTSRGFGVGLVRKAETTRNTRGFMALRSGCLHAHARDQEGQNGCNCYILEAGGYLRRYLAKFPLRTEARTFIRTLILAQLQTAVW